MTDSDGLSVSVAFGARSVDVSFRAVNGAWDRLDQPRGVTVATIKSANCRGCGVPLTDTNDSEAHIIPNALGGRLKPKCIICRECNTQLDRIADNALVQAFGS
jgi:HNH endonuclease